MKQTTRILLANLSILNCVICILYNLPSSVHGASASITSDFYEDSGGGNNDVNYISKNTLFRQQRGIENIGMVKSLVSNPQINYLSHTSYQSNFLHPTKRSRRSIPQSDLALTAENEEPYDTPISNIMSNEMDDESHSSDMSLLRYKREGFIDISDVPRMMRHMARGLGHGLPSMIHSMMMHGQHLGHQMASHFMPTKDPSPTIIHYGKPVISKPSPTKGSGSYNNQGPDIIYGEWVPISSVGPSPSTSYRPKPHPPKPSSGYNPQLINHVPIGPSEKPKPIFGGLKPAFVKPQPVYNKPLPPRRPPHPGRYPPPPLTKPPIAYKPVAFPNPHLQPTITSIVDQHYGSPEPTKEDDTYGTPVGSPVGPRPVTPSDNYPPPIPLPDPYRPPVTEGGNPFTPSPDPPPYQTTFTSGDPSLPPFETPSQPTSGHILAGTFSGGEIKDVVEAVHAVEDWSDDEHHIKPIRDNTLFYNDILLVKVKKDHKDGRSEKHSAQTAKEHHRVEKSAPPHGHEFTSSSLFSKLPFFPSFPPLSGTFQVHHLPPIPPVVGKKYRKRKAVPHQRARSPETIFHKLFF